MLSSILRPRASSPAFLTVGLPYQLVAAYDKSIFGKWEKEIAAFEAQDKEKAPPQGAIVFVCSSNIRL
jgi:hypothetical protein